MIYKEHERVLFTGDSVTDCGRKRPVGEGLGEGVGNGYVRMVDTILNTIYPELNVHVMNTGVSGDRTRDLLARFDRDVIALQPDHLYIMIGFNDVWRQFDEPTNTPVHVLEDEFRQNLSLMVEQAKKETHARITLITPHFIEPNKEDWMRHKMDVYGGIVKEVAKAYDVGCIDTQPAFDEFLKYKYSATLTWDRVHPGYYGSLLIAKEILKEAGFDRPVI